MKELKISNKFNYGQCFLQNYAKKFNYLKIGSNLDMTKENHIWLRRK